MAWPGWSPVSRGRTVAGSPPTSASGRTNGRVSDQPMNSAAAASTTSGTMDSRGHDSVSSSSRFSSADQAAAAIRARAARAPRRRGQGQAADRRRLAAMSRSSIQASWPGGADRDHPAPDDLGRIAVSQTATNSAPQAAIIISLGRQIDGRHRGASAEAATPADAGVPPVDREFTIGRLLSPTSPRTAGGASGPASSSIEARSAYTG